ncbi:substrate binding domain of ABC-type glycine betaine transport system family protein [Mycolicibacterium hassiacum DSM 44199]|mgnify:FL=1|jgi:osmoprotectant transport system substrate-binding protein|uniref:Substrate binding domain of ABC-type glycine betaine transport system family protein n=1 Tax=Mycolicibacterium hassiacum (strain DSM 44199 / CIP 105218 / JCM 12690 / 3849) TaxID=1122247 RepID=K5BFU9_MYCHD|nr:glycine betaine ABC transporter substrate-binding protein [Mycolicibacterium hassiacum]EKF23466.1 substrate binding domain of ABC-type glycine betaine transport system family protein [Mycolicibacterium hassiacum DSM 44199]MBX5485253.1 glycine betaine ABC transporter substrate-binding protein [Mycolicibacterium hassiacum]MDA4084713.1 glycine/betaine ABC transporter substrate-binding protein [Mycolicibacterium hassiacum DSM 44199]PZN19064.1 MAG: glycine/betaine ABC transporter substrate-bindin
MRHRIVQITACAAVVAGCGLGSGSTVPFQVGPGSIQHNPALAGVAITVGSKEYTEQVIMGYILEFTLAAAGAQVRDLTGIVGSRSTREAQLRGQVDVAYEFTGNAWINYLGHEKPIPDSRLQYEAVRDEDLARNDMVWLAPGPMDDTYALAASREVVERTGVRTLSQYAELVRTDPAAARTCVDTEFRARQDGYPGMAAAYGFDPARAQTPVLQVGIIYQATADAGQCDFGEVFTTDGRIAALDLVVLIDDKQFFAHYNPSVTMKREFFEAHPQIAEVTAPVTAALTNEVIMELNRQVDVEGRDPAAVARDWLVSEGFITEK